jgi:hypothetical protein
VLKAQHVGVPFILYIAAEDRVIGVVLTQETGGKEYVVTEREIGFNLFL